MINRIAKADNNIAGMLLFLVNEAVFFGYLIFTFINYHLDHSPNTGPSASSTLEPLLTGLFSIALLSSSFTIWRAEKSLERRNHTGVILWLAATVVLGVVFLVGQGLEYVKLLRDNVTPARNLFGSTFFTLTGIHGLHVFIGLVMISILTGLGLSGEFKGRKAGALGAVSLYWHFVDVVWVVIFTVVYIWAAGMSGAGAKL